LELESPAVMLLGVLEFLGVLDMQEKKNSY